MLITHFKYICIRYIKRKGMAQGIYTFVLGAKRAIRADAAFPALFSSTKLIVELIINRQIIPTKSCQSGPCP